MSNSTDVIDRVMNGTSTVPFAQNPELMLLSSIMTIVGPIILIALFMGRSSFTMLMFHVRVKHLLRQYSELTNRNVIIMSHVNAGLFGSMITMEDAMKIEALIRKFGDTKIDLIVNTFGGDLLASIYIANLLKVNNNIRVVVPKYAFSGGTFIALGATELLAAPKAMFGPVDPQFGSILNIMSAKYWQEIVKRKGDKGVKDDTLGKARQADEIMKEVKLYMEDLIKDRQGIDREKFFDLFLEGRRTHSNIIRIGQFTECGFPAKQTETDLPDRILEGMKKSGVFGHHHFKEKKGWKWFPFR